MLFTPLTIGRLTIAGRLVKTATSETRATTDGVTGGDLIDFYEPMARGGVPLVFTGNLYTSFDGKSTPRQAGIDDDDKIPGLAVLVSAVHKHGTKIVAQVNHCGRQVVSRSIGGREAVSASSPKELFIGTKPRPLTGDEIARVVGQFADAAERCVKAGFDGVRIHAATAARSRTVSASCAVARGSTCSTRGSSRRR